MLLMPTNALADSAGFAPAALVTPATNDNTQLMAPIFIIIAIALVVIGIVVARRSKRDDDNGKHGNSTGKHGGKASKHGGDASKPSGGHFKQ